MNELELSSEKFRIAVVGQVSKKQFNALSDVEFFQDLKTFLPNAASFEVLVYRGEEKLGEEFFKTAKNLKLLVKPAAGVDNIDLQTAEKFKVKVRNVPNGGTTSVAEYTIAVIISLFRKLPQAYASTKRGEWRKTDFYGFELQGKTVGVIGLGKIGIKVVNILKAFNVKLVGFDPYLPVESFNDVQRVNNLDDLLRVSDVITIHVPLENSTRHLINASSLKLVKKGAFLVNVSRGEVIEEKALIESLKSGDLAGAALDVFQKEPLEKCELHELDNVILTPHIAASTIEAQEKIALEAIEIIKEFKNELIREINSQKHI